jgi:hypothetical protein
MPNFGEPSQSEIDRRGIGLLAPETIDTRGLRNELMATQLGLYTGLPVDQPMNPPADPDSWKVSPNAMGKARAPKLLRGRLGMWQVENQPPEGTNVRRARSINFLFNPNTISHSYAFDSSALAENARAAGDDAPVLMSGQSVQWKLYFNRTYEVSKNARNPGTLADITALERVLGVKKPGAGVAANQVVVIFGATEGGIPFGYTGWITNASIEHRMFSHRMIPTVTEVDIQLARRMIPDTIAPPNEFGNTSTYGSLSVGARPTVTRGSQPGQGGVPAR